MIYHYVPRSSASGAGPAAFAAGRAPGFDDYGSATPPSVGEEKRVVRPHADVRDNQAALAGRQ